jgi:hypothetical protein
MLNRKSVSKIWVFTHKPAFMQRIADYVRRGHQAYIQGKTDVHSIHETWFRLASNNPVFDDRLKAFRAREKGEPTARLLLWQNPKAPEKVHWFVLVHGRKDQLAPGEKWRHAEDPHGRIRFTGYELVRVTKEGLKKPVWTWRYTEERYQDIRDLMVHAIRSHRDDELKKQIDSIFGTMGFSGSREQAKKLTVLLKSEWHKRRANEPLPDMPKGIGFIRRKADKGIFLIRPKPEPKKKPSAYVPAKNLLRKGDAKTVGTMDWFLAVAQSDPSFASPVKEGPNP